MLAVGFLSCCARFHDPQAEFGQTRRDFLHGDLKQSQRRAHSAGKHFLRFGSEWTWKFKTLEAEAALWQGLYRDALTILDSHPEPQESDVAVSVFALRGVANAYLHRFSEADAQIKSGETSCATAAYAGCGEVIQARGIFESQQGRLSVAESAFHLTQHFARAHGDLFLESTALLNLGAMSLAQGHFDEAIDRSEAAYQAAIAGDARVIQVVAQGNIGWAYYKLGDSEKAMDLSTQAESLAAQLQDISDQENELVNIGYIYLDQRKFDQASQSFTKALQLAEGIDAKEDIYNAQRVLARLALQTGHADEASRYANQALQIAQASHIHSDELYPQLVLGQVAAQRGDSSTARQVYEQVKRDQECPVFLKWEAQHSLARLYEQQKRFDAADVEYRAALDSFETARATVRREDFQISFLGNASRIYDDYVHFLVSRSRPEQALRWADYSRARTMWEGLGLLGAKGANSNRGQFAAGDATAIARRATATLLFYWLGEKESYLWAISPKTTQVFTLPPGAQIEAAVKRYRSALIGPQDVLVSGGEDGQALYRMLIAPAESLLGSSKRVFVLPDGGLNNLNFETLIVPSPKPHYWIEDADIVNASSLRVLDASLTAQTVKTPRLLLIGDSVSPSRDYPELPKASDQMASVARLFPAARQQVYQRAEATPQAYLGSDLEDFSHIHFVAHGTASRLSPLDSAIVLSKDTNNPESFKLYARDIIHHRLRAELVTISACYGAGERQYSGEGLVGLAWAFLRAGSRNVIAALWEVSDAATDQLMTRFYEEMAKGASPDVALRTAKLAMLRASAFHHPFYWAPFQIYRG